MRIIWTAIKWVWRTLQGFFGFDQAMVLAGWPTWLPAVSGAVISAAVAIYLWARWLPLDLAIPLGVILLAAVYVLLSAMIRAALWFRSKLAPKKSGEQTRQVPASELARRLESARLKHGVTLSEEAEAVAQRINLLGATYSLWMPDAGAGYRQHNDSANAHYLRAYREEIATDAQLVLQAAQNRGILRSPDTIYLHNTVAGREAVEEISRAMLRIVVALAEPTMPSAESQPPALRSSFSMGNPTCVVRDVPVLALLDGQELKRRDYYRLEVAAHNAIKIANCRGRLLWVERDGERVFSDPINLPFAPSHLNDAFSKTTHQGVPEHLDVLAIDYFDQVELTAPNLPTSLPATLFWGAATYRLRVAILSEAPAIQGDFVLEWKEYRRTANVTYSEVPL